MQQTVTNIGNPLLKWNEIIQELIGIEPVLVLSVIVFVTLIAKLFQIRDRAGKYGKFILVSHTIAVSVAVSTFAIPFTEAKEAARNSLVLSGVSTVVRNFGKPLYASFKSFLYKKFEKWTGEKVVEEPDDDRPAE